MCCVNFLYIYIILTCTVWLLALAIQHPAESHRNVIRSGNDIAEKIAQMVFSNNDSPNILLDLLLASFYLIYIYTFLRE